MGAGRIRKQPQSVANSLGAATAGGVRPRTVVPHPCGSRKRSNNKMLKKMLLIAADGIRSLVSGIAKDRIEF